MWVDNKQLILDAIRDSITVKLETLESTAEAWVDARDDLWYVGFPWQEVYKISIKIEELDGEEF